SLDRITDVLEFRNSIDQSSSDNPFEIDGGSIKFDKVSFAYDLGVQVLNNVSFEIEAGKKIALVGHTGAGKSTIANLLLRFYDPNEGSIEIDGQNLIDVKTRTIHEKVGVVNQEPYIFADSVLENIRYGNQNATDDQVYAVCKLVGVHEFIEILPDEYQTRLQESGKSLSAGQRQMIAIARTMLSDPKILVLDEATSRLDAYTESLIQNAQKVLFEGRTTLIIAHRLSTIRDVDKIIVLENGEIKEQGTHNTLIKNQGVYSELYNVYYKHQGIEVIPEVSTNGI
ncbi:MAG: ATP-binding cassette domain-containing protein, partial [Candidatus Heimdallarchaeota archaeon]|nr:ATP-binding cassette domain-containing protein [Candidatus Heimdallarchaeota archaeon]